MAAATLAVATFFAICATQARATAVPDATWPEFQFQVDDNAVFTKPAWSVFWRTDLGMRINGGLAVVGTRLYAEDFDKKTYAIDARTGRKIWEQAADNVVMSTPLVSDGIVIVGSGTGAEMLGNMTQAIWGRPAGDAIYGFDARTGARRWRFSTVGEDMATGVVINDGRLGSRYVFCNGDQHAYALDVATGAERGAGAGDQQRPDLRVLAAGPDHRAQRRRQIVRQRVADLRPVERDDRDAVADRAQ